MEEFVHIVMQNFFVPFIPFSAFGEVHKKCVNCGVIYRSYGNHFAGIEFFVQCVFIKILSIEEEHFGERSLRKIIIDDAIGIKSAWYLLYRLFNELFLFRGRLDGMGIRLKFVKIFLTICLIFPTNSFVGDIRQSKVMKTIRIDGWVLVFGGHPIIIAYFE